MYKLSWIHLVVYQTIIFIVWIVDTNKHLRDETFSPHNNILPAPYFSVLGSKSSCIS